MYPLLDILTHPPYLKLLTTKVATGHMVHMTRLVHELDSIF